MAALCECGAEKLCHVELLRAHDEVILKLKQICIDNVVGWDSTKLMKSLHTLCAEYGYPVPTMPRKR